MAPVVLPRTCRQCGTIFNGGPRAWYCPDCRLERRREADRRLAARGRVPLRPLGSIDKCTVCGKDYIVNSSNQKYCPECAYDAVREIDRAASRAWNQAHKDTYYPIKNKKRNEERKKNPEKIRAKERAVYQKRLEKKKQESESQKEPPHE